jgi:hypothetical protein
MALQVYKVLGQVKIPTVNTYQDLYTVPANAMAQVYVVVNNFNSGTHTFNVAVSRNGAAVANGDEIYHDISLTNGTEYVTATFTLAAGDIIRVQASDLDFTFQVHGAEIYTPSAGVYFDVYESGVSSTVRLYNIEQNLKYIFTTDEDCKVRVGFDGYGSDNEFVVDFPSPTERATFVAALEQARIYGNYGTFDPVVPMVYIGDNTIVGSSTTTTSTSTTSTTSTTTVAPASTTTTTVEPTTTTTTLAPPTVWWQYDINGTSNGALTILRKPAGESVFSTVFADRTTAGYDDILPLADGDTIQITLFSAYDSRIALLVYDSFLGDYVVFNSSPTTLDEDGYPIYSNAIYGSRVLEFTLEAGLDYRIEVGITDSN